jgi:hypothetical protein
MPTGTGAHPGGQLLGSGKRGRRRAGFCDDLLRGIHAAPGDLGEAQHRIVVCHEQVCHLLIELTEVILDQPQVFQRELQLGAVAGMQCLLFP